MAPTTVSAALAWARDASAELRSLCAAGRERLASTAAAAPDRADVARLVTRALAVLDGCRDLLDTLLLVQRRASGDVGGGVVPPGAHRWLQRLRPKVDAVLTRGRTVVPATAADTRTTPGGDDVVWRERSSLFQLLSEGVGAVAPTAVPVGHTRASWRCCDTDASTTRGGVCCRRSRMVALVHVTQQLRRLERTEAFQTDLVADTKAVMKSKGVGYSRDNFAYGTTPFFTWRRVFALPAVAAGLSTCATPAAACDADLTRRPHTVVFGSSHGMLAFNIALFAGVCTVGYELLPVLHGHATRVAASAGVPSRLLQLRCADMLTADVAACRVCLLTSQCWDAELQEAVHAKLASELPAGAVVVDYGSRMDRVPAFQAAGVVAGEVSWDARLWFHVYTKR